MMRTTLKAVAERSELSLQTVSRILNGHAEQYQEATRERVLRAADELGYRPNSSAKAMRSGRFGSVALLLSENSGLSILPTELREGIQDALNAHETNLILSRFSDAELTHSERTPRILREIMADGLLINYNTHFPQSMADIITQHNIPAVWINTRQPADCVFPDDREGGRLAAERLLALGHSRIAFAYVRETWHYSFPERLAGYEEAMHAVGLPTQRCEIPIALHRPDEVLAATPFLDGPERTTGFILYASQGLTMLLAAILLRGLALPGDAAIVCFNDTPLTFEDLPVDTMLLPEREVGRAAARMLLKKIENPHTPQEPVSLPPSLIPGHYGA